MMTRNVKKTNIVSPMIWLCVLLVCACNQLENDAGLSLPDEVTNREAQRFIDALNASTDQQPVFQSLTKGKQVYFEDVRLCNSSMHGMVFIVPFGTEGTISGALYYPVGFTQLDDERVELNNKLKSPQVVTAETLNNDIPITQRFLYSNDFTILSDKGLQVDDSLKAYEFLKDSMMPLTQEQLPETRYYNPYLNGSRVIITIDYSANYVGQPDGDSHGLYHYTVERWAEEALRQTMINPYVCRIEKGWYLNKIEITIPCEQLYNVSSDPRSYVMYYGNILRGIAITHSFSFFLQATYRVDGATYWDRRGGTIGIVGESRPETNNGPYTGNLGLGIFPKSKIPEECDSLPYSNEAKRAMKEMLDSLFSLKPYKGQKKNYIDLSQFKKLVKEHGNVEHVCVINVYDDNRHYMLEPEGGGLVDRAPYTANFYTKYTLHNHPNLTPPSAKDLLNLCSDAASQECPNMRGSFVFIDENTYYALIINDRKKAAAMFKEIEYEVAENNDFKMGGKCDRILKQYEHLNTFKSSNETAIARLSTIINHFDGGISIVKCHITDKPDYTTYGSEKVSYKPIKC
ncbi:hypothetical protein [Prevotella sp. oral taxon 317]|uniref:hypothetical protein n=1 Tax=Prevotella sp. oral taxon 317 TaxID=652721 RepID=UPI0005C60CF2|nr:hypothetical protein [Prevotella sp. oral taxon 317]